MAQQPLPPPPVLWRDYAGDWRRHMLARNLSLNTVRIYLTAFNQLAAYVAAHHGEVEIADVNHRMLEGWLVWRRQQLTPRGRTVEAGTVSNEYRALQQLFKWLAVEEEIADPFAKLSSPIVPEQPVEILTDQQLEALLKVCGGKSFKDRRDTAIIRLLMDTGGRRGELEGLSIDDVDQDAQLLHVIGKGRRARALPYGAKSADALSRYLRARRAELARSTGKGRPASDASWLWLAARNRGRLEANGMKIMLRKRGLEAGVPGVHAHRFRHTMSHDFLASGGSEIDLMRLNGWKSPAMLRRYGASKADERAHQAHKRMARGDRI